MCPNDADRMANSVDPPIRLLKEQSDLGLLFAHTSPVCPKTSDHYGKVICILAKAQQNKQNNVQPVKTQISLGIHPGWSMSFLGA